MQKCSENIDISAESIFMQLPGYVCARGLENNFLFGNLMVAKLAGFKSVKQLDGFTDFDAPWCKIADSLRQQDYDTYNGLIYKQIDPVMSSSGAKVLLTTKSPYYDKDGNIAAIIVLCIEISNREIIEIASLIECDVPFNQCKSIVISGNDYIFSKCEKKLTPRELECVFYTLRGRSSKRIAKILKISPRTVEEHINNVKLKFDCGSKDELIEFAYKHNFSRFIPETLLNNKLLASLSN